MTPSISVDALSSECRQITQRDLNYMIETNANIEQQKWFLRHNMYTIRVPVGGEGGDIGQSLLRHGFSISTTG